MEFTLVFIHKLFWNIYLALPPLAFLTVILIVLGLIAGCKEKWSVFDSIYWAFITALTVGYGDIKPSYKLTKVLAMITALLGIMLFGIVVAITVNTFDLAFQEVMQLGSVLN